jgi:hypothetical protein
LLAAYFFEARDGHLAGSCAFSLIGLSEEGRMGCQVNLTSEKFSGNGSSHRGAAAARFRLHQKIG